MYRIIRYTQPRLAGFSPVLAARNPWTALESDMDRLFSAALSGLAAPAASPAFPVDLFEDKDSLHVRAELPGVAREDIALELEQDTLTITASRKAGDDTAKLSRSFTLTEPVQADKITAAYENGVLTVTLPRQEPAKPRKLNITIN